MEEKTQSPLLTPILTGTGALLLAYVLIFVLICLDELILRTYFISNYIPLGPNGEEFIRTIYFPLLWILNLL